MSDLHLNFGAQPNERPGDDDAREARHQVLATLLGAYADGELPPETASQIDAHLLGCARCRREVELHAVVSARLSREPQVLASSTFRDRVMQEIAETRLPSAPRATASRAWWQSPRIGVGAALIVLALTAALSSTRWRQDAVRARPVSARVDAVAVPLFVAILDDYRRVMAGDLPGRARDLDAVRAAVPFPVQPLRGAGASLLAAWSTDLRGEPAAVLAYRWHDRLVLEYLVAEPVFFRHPGLRAPIAAGQLVSAVSSPQGLLAWAAPQSGAILVGDVAPDELSALRVGDAVR
ncbi:MAG: zf-HC2 domain-containing protein [Gemmatimonadaceae bacterium]|nr:zf-HC2 domain-containing protein [Gemmatimonadaceae bacterium]